jgi:hypothetical protein
VSPQDVSFTIGHPPLLPSLWWDRFLDEAEEENRVQCKECAGLREAMKAIVIHHKDPADTKKKQTKERTRLQKELALHRLTLTCYHLNFI